MTVAFRASSTAADSSNSSTVACTIPGAAQVGDILIAWAAEQASATWTADTGLGSPTYVSSRTNLALPVWVYPLVAGNPGATVTFTSTDTAHRPIAGMIVMSGAGTVDVSGLSNGNSPTVDGPSVTATRDHDAIITIGAMMSAVSRTWTGWTGSTAGPSGGNGSGGSGCIEHACFYKLDQGTAAATGTLSMTPTSTSNNWVSITLGLSQAGGITVNGTLAMTTTASMTLTGSNASATANAFYATASGNWHPINSYNSTIGGQWR